MRIFPNANRIDVMAEGACEARRLEARRWRMQRRNDGTKAR